MKGRCFKKWMAKPEIQRILFSFSIPKTPRQVEKELGIKKLKVKPFLEKGLLKSLNPEASKGRFYVLTSKARKLLQLPQENGGKIGTTDWALLGWILASPKQRLVMMKVIDGKMRTSEELRIRARKHNPCLTRISTKGILRELVGKGLVQTEMGSDRRRYYWMRKADETFSRLVSSYGFAGSDNLFS